MGGTRSDTGFRALLTGACIVVVIAGLKAAGPLLMPILFSAFLAVLCIPAVNFLKRRGLPDWVSVPAVFVSVLSLFVLISMVVTASIDDFREGLPEYEAKLDARIDTAAAWAKRHGLPLPTPLEGSQTPPETAGEPDAGAAPAEVEPSQVGPTLLTGLDRTTVLTLVGSTVGAVADLLSNTLFVLLTVVFILFEVAGFPRKLREALRDPSADLGHYKGAIESIQSYLRIKTEVSLVTGICAGILCLVCGVDYALLWGAAAFLLNYVPTVGSLIAAVPPMLLAFVQFGGGRMTAVAIGYVVINTVIGNVLEPRLMGRKLGLSSLVVFLSLVFWGWVWGPIGMLLSVPLTMLVKLLLEHSDDLRWIAVLLGPGGETMPEPSPAAPPPPSGS